MWWKQFDKLLLFTAWLVSIVVLLICVIKKGAMEEKLFWIVLTWAVSQSSSVNGALLLLITGRSGQARVTDKPPEEGGH